MDLVRPASVIDFGCGVGTWLQEFSRHGVVDVFGIDGRAVNVAELKIAANRFKRHRLDQPLRLDRRFDLALCLDVAEEVPEPRADHLIQTLTQTSPIVCFSAAIPSQGGPQHVNEQWPEYWIRRFEAHQFQFIDAIRPRIWNHPIVEFWHAQNVVLFVHEEVLWQSTMLRQEWERSSRQQVAMVHPRLFLRTAQELENTIDYRVRRTWIRTAELLRRILKAA
jgi:SAM-dependent methyltransferase